MSGYIGTQPVPQATQTRDAFTATAGQTSFATLGYTPSFLDVYLNGIKLAAADYTASNGSDVVLASGAALDDILEVVAYSSFEVVTDTVTNAGTVLNLDRTGSDGTILDLKKDGSTVGSIGVTQSGANIYYAGGAAKSGVEYSNSAWRPWYDGARSDNVVDLGTTSNRFKDLYLSGGVYLGGTSSANKLDDYEEGTWTPVYSDAVSGGNTAVANGGKRGKYTKIGNLVTVTASCSNLDTTGMTGSNDLRITGLPFVCISLSGTPTTFWVGAARLGSISFEGYVTAHMIDGAQYVRLSETRNNATVDQITVSNLNSGAADIHFTITYETSA